MIRKVRLRLRVRNLGSNQMRGNYNYFVNVQTGNTLLAQSFSPSALTKYIFCQRSYLHYSLFST